MTDPTPSRISEDGNVIDIPSVTVVEEGVFHGQSLRYAATAGRLPIVGVNGVVDAQMFYVAYVREEVDPASRPVVFLTNGGPGAATAWLHLGGLGPRRIIMNDDGSTPSPPARITENPDCALDAADLVFIDAIGTGYSRAASDEAKKRFFEREGDLESYVAFILQYLQQNARWGSPIYLLGESYGGMRVAALSDLLVRRGVPVSGAVILSSALDFQLLSPSLTNPLPYALTLPSFATVAAHHRRIEPSLCRDGDSLRREVEQWAETVYLPALLKGRRLSGVDRDRVVAGLVRYTGLPEAVIRAEQVKIDVPTFMKYLLADQGLVVGRTDGRIAGAPVHDRVEEPYYDPAMGAMTPAFSAATRQLLTGSLRVPLDIPYRMYSRDVASRFVLGPAATYGRNGYPQSLTALQAAAVKNPAFRILSLQGLYDLAAPYWSTEHGLDQLLAAESFAAQITQVRLPGGHMSYADEVARKRIGTALTEFLRPL